MHISQTCDHFRLYVMKDSHRFVKHLSCSDVFILKVNLRLKEKNADHRSVVWNNRLKRAGSW